MTETNSVHFLDQTTPPPQSTDSAAKAIDAAGNALLGRLDVGGKSEVYRFGDEALRRDLAIKVLKAEFHATFLHLLGLDHTKLAYRLSEVYGEVVKEILA